MGRASPRRSRRAASLSEAAGLETVAAEAKQNAPSVDLVHPRRPAFRGREGGSPCRTARLCVRGRAAGGRFTVERQAGDVKPIFVGRLRLANILRGKADLDIVHLLFTLSRRVSAVFSTGPND